MKHPLFFASPFVLALLGFVGAQASGCSGSLDTSADAGGSDAASSADAGPQDSGLPPVQFDDAAVQNCHVNAGEDFIDFCQQKQILVAEHAVFNADAGIASSWNTTTGLADTDGGVVVHDFHDDVAYAASLSLYAISAETYGDTEINASILAPDLKALVSIVGAELATLPASYDGELYRRLRRFQQGLNYVNDTADVAKIDAIAEAYGRAIYSTYYHPLASGPAGDAGDDGGGDDAGDAGDAGALDGGGTSSFADGILGVAATGGGFQYDVDQAASGALALVDLASRHETDDPTDAHAWARAAGSVFNHLYARARHTSGLYYADLVTSSDPDHDALASVVTPSDALLGETQASVAISLLRATGIVENANMTELSLFPFSAEVVSPLSGLAGVAPDGGAGFSLWDPTPTADTTAACALLTGDAAAACGGSGFFLRYLPSTTGLDNSEKTLRANALAFAAVHRSLILGTAASIDYEPLSALMQSTQGVNASFLSQVFQQAAYLPALKADLSPLGSSYTVQANAFAIEALTEQWVGEHDCPTEFF